MQLSMSDLRELLCDGEGHGPVPVVAKAIRIVVLQRGWIVVGVHCVDGDEVVIQNSSVIRRWGTTAGLGELAEKGPLPDTKMDPSGTVRAPLEGVVLTMDCNETKWSQSCR